MGTPRSKDAGSRRALNKTLRKGPGNTSADKERRKMVKPITKSAPTANKKQVKALADMLTPQDASLYQWLMTITNPWTKTPVGAPVVYGDFNTQSSMNQYRVLVNPKPNDSGVCFAGLCADAWVSSINDAGVQSVIQRFAAYDGNGGGVLFYTDQTYVGTDAPDVGDIPDFFVTYYKNKRPVTTKYVIDKSAKGAPLATRVGLGVVRLPVLSSDQNSDASYRMVSAGLRVRPLLGSGGGASTDRGQFLVASSKDCTANPTNGGFSSTDWGLLHENDMVCIDESNVVGWSPEKMKHGVCVPTEDTAFQMLPVTGSANTGGSKVNYASVLFAANGCPAGGSFTFEVEAVWNYEFTKTASWKVESDGKPMVPADDRHMKIAANNVRPVGLLPVPNHVGAMGKTLAMVAPSKLPHFLNTSGGGFLSTLGNIASGAINFLSGAAGKVLSGVLLKQPHPAGKLVGGLLAGLGD